MIEHLLFALSPFLRQDMRHNRPVHVLPITDWHSQTGNQIEIPYLKKQAGGGNRTRIISLEGSTIYRPVSLQCNGFENEKATCEMFGEMFCSESSLKAKISKSRIG